MAGQRLRLRTRRTAQAQPTPSVERTITRPPLTPIGDHIKETCIAANKRADDTIEDLTTELPHRLHHVPSTTEPGPGRRPPRRSCSGARTLRRFARSAFAMRWGAGCLAISPR